MKPRAAFVYDDELPTSVDIDVASTAVTFGDPPGTKAYDQYRSVVVNIQNSKRAYDNQAMDRGDDVSKTEKTEEAVQHNAEETTRMDHGSEMR